MGRFLAGLAVGIASVLAIDLAYRPDRHWAAIADAQSDRYLIAIGHNPDLRHGYSRLMTVEETTPGTTYVTVTCRSQTDAAIEISRVMNILDTWSKK